MANKLIDLTGLGAFLAKLKNWTTAQINSAKTALQTNIDKKVDKTTTVNGHALSGNVTVTKADVGLSNVTNDAQVKRTEMGAANGVATLGTDGKVPTAQLPSFVDDIKEYSEEVSGVTVTNSTAPKNGAGGVVYDKTNKVFLRKIQTGSATAGNLKKTYYTKWDDGENMTSGMFGEETSAGVKPVTNKIYYFTGLNKDYRWSGSALVEISPSLALGTTSSTAFRGDYGNTAYQHATKKGAAFGAGLYKITTNSEGHVTVATAVTKSDITNLGIPGSDTKYTLPTATSSVLGGVKLGSDTVQQVGAGTPSATSGRTYAVQRNQNGQMVVNVPWVNTTYSTATSSANGLMSASDKQKLTELSNTNFLLESLGLTKAGGDGFLQKISAVTPNTTQITMQFVAKHISSTGAAEDGFQTVTLPAAKTTQAGLMSAADKAKLDGYSVATTAEVEALF